MSSPRCPAELAIGAGTALFVAGTCFAPGERIASLTLLVDGEEQPLGGVRHAAAGAAASASEPGRLPQRLLGHRADRARARRRRRWRCGRAWRAAARRTAPLATIPLARAGRAALARRPAVAICMTTCDPPLELFRRQVDSIRAQTHERLGLRRQRRLLGPRALRRDPRTVLGDDPRFLLSRAAAAARLLPQLRARARRWSPPSAAYVALADQDDRWHPDKLATLLAALGDARLVYSDARVVAGDGRVLGRQLLGPPHATTTRACCRCWWRTRSPAPRRSSRADAARRRAAVPARPVRPLPRPLARARGARRSATSRSSSGRSTTTSSTATRRSATPRPTACRRCASGSARCAATRASGSGCGGCTTTSTPAGCCSSRPCCGCAAGSGCRRPSAASSSASSAPTARSPRSPGSRGAARRSCSGRRRDTLGAEWMLFHAFAWRRLLSATARDRPTRFAAARLAPAARLRPAARARARPPSPPARVIAREDRAAAARGQRRRAAADQPADPVDRPPALLRRLHRQVQPRPAARRAGRAGAHRHRRPGRLAPALVAAATSRPTAGSTGCSARSRSRSAASRRASR